MFEEPTSRRLSRWRASDSILYRWAGTWGKFAIEFTLNGITLAALAALVFLVAAVITSESKTFLGMVFSVSWLSLTLAVTGILWCYAAD